MLYIKNGMVHDGVHREGFRADILVEDGKIKAIGEHMEGGHSMEGEHSMEEGHSMEIPAGAEIVDAEGLQVYPGFVEAHGHIGLDGYGIGYEGMDYNELNDIISPQMRGIDGVKPTDPAFPKAAAAGVTCVCVGPGSANVLGGTFTTIKTVGKRVDDMVVRDGVAMKCAFGENPKRVYRDKKDSSRMTTA
ncbi:MAG: amidohydrolase, partial [Lachnospiraceae bacterium]|nr:amidohydrolase [Lachnospiraceae bacterium]